MNQFAAAAAAQAGEEAIEITKLPKVAGRKAHIDGDYLAYYASGNDETVPGMARMNALAFINRAVDRTGSESAVVHLTAPGCHKGERYLAATVKPYQAQRSDGRKPVNWAYLREWLTGYEGHDFIKKVWSTREADDGIAVCADYAVRNERLDAIVTADKDMQMLPGIHMDWKNPDILTEVPANAYEVIGENDKLYGEKWFWLQMLQGDTADNIPGLEFVWKKFKTKGEERMTRCGPQVAKEVLWGIEDRDTAARVVLDHYRRGYKGTRDGDDRFCEQACLLWLRRDNEASVLNFMRHMPPGIIDADLAAASQRLNKRIIAARETLNNP